MLEYQSLKINKLKSRLKLWWYKSEVYDGKEQNELTRNKNEWMLNYNGKDYIFVRRKWIPKSFENMKMEVKDFDY
jgi:hypothetical protein